MKFAVIALLAAVVASQDVSAATKTTALAAGTGANNKATSTGNVAVAVVAGVSGSAIASQTVAYPSPAANNIVQSWMTFKGVADDGKDVIAIGLATYGSNVSSAATIATQKKCGTVTNYSTPGAASMGNSLSTSNCSLAAVQSYVQTGTSFTQTATIALLPKATSGYLVLGSSLSVTAGWNIYLNPASTAAIVDSYSGSSATVTLSGALALTMSGAAAALATLAF